MSRIVTAFVEEHHELFMVWEWAVRHGVLRPQGARLLHVDEHSDLDIPYPRCPMDFENSAENVSNFFREELTVANWLWPLVYRGRLNNISWLFPRRRAEGHRDYFPPRRLFITTTGNRRNEVFTGLHRGQGSLKERFDHDGWNPDYRTVWIEQLGADCRLDASGQWVLGICLDYFSCNTRAVANNWLFEITAEQRRSFEADDLHFLRLLPGPQVRTQHIEGRDYLVFGNPIEPEWDWRVLSEAQIAERLKAFQGFLERNGVSPELVVVSRSVKSGYTPAKQAAFIEEGVREILASTFGARIEERAGSDFHE